MIDLKSKTFVVYDSGLMVSVAERLARDAGRVVYFCPWVTDLSCPDLADIGTGIPGVERAKYFWDIVGEFDPKDDDVCFVFTGIGFGDVQEQLFRMGFPVWGSRKGEEMEMFRDTMKQAQKRLGLAVNPYEVVTGIERLRFYLDAHPDTYVKVSEFRGITESFHAETYELVEARLDAMAAQLGPIRKRTQQFICEKSIPTKIETGGDHYVVDGQFTEKQIFGLEIKDCLYCLTAVPQAKLPACIQELNTALAPMLKAYGYRGPFHSEIRVGEDGKNYFIDATCRTGSPPTETMLEWMTNFSETVWETAHGRLVEFETEKAYGVQICLISEQAPESWLAVSFPKEIARWVKLYNHAMNEDGLSYVVATDSKLKQIGYVVGLGDNIEEAAMTAAKHAKLVKADKLEAKFDAVPKLVEELKAAKAKGITLGDGEIPEIIEV